MVRFTCRSRAYADGAASARLAFRAGVALVVMLPACDVRRPSSTETASELGVQCRITTQLTATLGSVGDSASVRYAYGVDIANIPGLGWVVSEHRNEVFRYAPDGTFAGSLGTRGMGPGEYTLPLRLAVDPTDSLWLSDQSGRTIVFSPEGRPSRTITRAGLGPIDGFNERGDPYSIFFRPPIDAVEDPSQGAFLARFWDRVSGNEVFSLGPANDRPGLAERDVPVIGVGVSVIGDVVYVSQVAGNGWIVRWTRTGVDTVAKGDAILALARALTGGDAILGGEPTGLARSGPDGFMITAAFRRLSAEEERALVQRTSAEMGMNVESVTASLSPEVRNEVFDGAILHVGWDGEVTAVTTFADYPAGFVSNSPHFFTFHRTASGLIETRIWRYDRECA